MRLPGRYVSLTRTSRWAKHADDYDHRYFPTRIADPLADPRPTLSPALFRSSSGPLSKLILGCLRRIRRTSRARVTAPKTRTAGVTAIGPALTSSAASAGRFRDRRDPVEVGRVGHLLDVVEDVVQTGRKRVDVLVVERGDEALSTPSSTLSAC
jgi:hypothetical protein